MKQHITVEQLNELTKNARLKLKKWYYPKKAEGDKICYDHPIVPHFKNKVLYFGFHAIQGDPLPLLSVGQMIEFIIQHNKPKIKMVHQITWIDGQEPCDVLWEEVKEVLMTD